MNGASIVLASWVGFCALRGYRQGYIVRFFALAATVLAWVCGFLYGPWLAKVLVKQPEVYLRVATLVSKAELQPSVQVSSGGIISIDLPLPSTIVEHINQHVIPHVPSSNQVMSYTTSFLSNMFINLFCFGLIVLIVKMVLTVLVHFFNAAIRADLRAPANSTLGLLLGLADSCVMLVVLLGLLVPLLIIAAPGNIQSQIMESRALNMLVDMFYRLQPQLF